MTQNQKEKRIGGSKMSDAQKRKKFGGAGMSDSQRRVISKGRPQNGQGRKITPDMVMGTCSNCGKKGHTKKGKDGRWSRHTPKDESGKTKACGYYFPCSG
jgi:hypothetical protein